MSIPAALFARTAVLLALLFGFGAVAAGAAACGPAGVVAHAATAMPCEQPASAPLSGMDGSCALLCGAVAPAAVVLPVAGPALPVVHVVANTAGVTRVAAPEPPPPRSA